MGINVVCFTVVWQDESGQKHCLLAKHHSEPNEEIVKWIECDGFGRAFASHLYYAVASITPWLSGVSRNRRQENAFLQPYFGEYYNEWHDCNVVYCSLQQFLQFRECADQHEEYAKTSQDEARPLQDALAELHAASRFRNMLWYWPFGWNAREQRFESAQTVVKVLKQKEQARRERKIGEYRSKMFVLEENVVQEVKDALGKGFKDGLEEEQVGILFICY